VIELGQEDAEAISPAMEVAFDGAFGDLEVLRDECDGPIELVEEDDDLALDEGEFEQGDADGGSGACGGIGACDEVGLFSRGCVGDGVGIGAGGLSRGGVEVDASRDGEEPGGESVSRVEAIEIGQNAHEGFLHDIFGDFGPTGHAEDVGVERELVGAEADGGGVAVAGGGESKETLFFVAIHG
jgi:hypothetical protein